MSAEQLVALMNKGCAGVWEHNEGTQQEKQQASQGSVKYQKRVQQHA